MHWNLVNDMNITRTYSIDGHVELANAISSVFFGP